MTTSPSTPEPAAAPVITDETQRPLRHWAWFGITLPAALVALDQLSKWATLRFFDLPMNACAIGDPSLTHEVSPIGDLSIICNRGISWGLLQGDSDIKRWGLTAFAALMAVVLIYALAKTKDRLGRFGLSLVIAGAVGNAIDRAFFGAVTDMLNFSDIGFNYIFNVADSYITVGVVILLVSSWWTERQAKRASA